mgnify:CR=1 FL=1
MLYREPKLLKFKIARSSSCTTAVSVLYREPKLLKFADPIPRLNDGTKVSVLYREPKLLKYVDSTPGRYWGIMFQCSTVSRNC